MNKYFKNSKIKVIRVKEGRKILKFKAEIVKKNLLSSNESKVKKGIREFLKYCWGDFGEDFIEKHIINTNWALFLREDDRLVGITAVSKKNILNKNIYYLEFTGLLPEIRSLGLMGRINSILFNHIFIDNLIKNGKLTVDIMFISPNPRVLGFLAKVAKFMYPNPLLFDTETKKIPPADEETWQIVEELIRQSDKPNRILHRDGCVLEGSYADMPWLIYKKDEVPWYRNKLVNDFCETYLDYQKEEGKEFIIRAEITLRSLVVYYIKEFLNNFLKN